MAKLAKNRGWASTGLAVTAFLLLGGTAGAQRAPVAARPLARPARAPMQAPRAPIQGPRTVRTTPTARQPFRNHGKVGSNNFFGRGRHSQSNCGVGALQQLANAYPAYGFNFAYQNAINGDLALKAAIDPATQLRLAETQRFGCESFTGGGYYVLGGGYGYPVARPEEEEPESAPAPVQPQVIVLQQPPEQKAPTQADSDFQQEAAPSVQDEGQFVLVLRDGSQVQALAFMRSKDSVTYITTEGARRSIALADLDPSETMRVNQERGTPLKLPL